MLQHAASERDPFGEADEPGPGPRRRGARGLRPGGLVADDFDEQAGPAVGCDGDGDGGAGRVLARVGQPVGADNAVTSCDLRVLVDQAAERSRRRTRMLSPAGARWVLPSGGCWLRVRCGRWVL